MAEPPVVHVVAADVPAGRLAVLRALRARPELATAHRVIHVGPGKPKVPDAARVTAPLDARPLRTRALRHALDRVTDSGRAARRCVLHVWSPTALVWSVPLADPECVLAVEVQPDDDLRGLSRWFVSRPSTSRDVLVCPTALVRRRLLELGVSPRTCVTIRESVDPGELARAERAVLRDRLDLTPEQTAVVVLPPVSRAAGTLAATWAALVLQKVRSDVRLVVPAGGRERQRAWRFIRSCRQERVVRLVGEEFSPAELASLADLAVFLPSRDVPLTGLFWAMAAGRPIISTAVPAVTEVLVDGRNARLCRPGAPADAARLMLQALERPEESQRLTDAARADSVAWFDERQMIESYARLYARLAGGMPTCPPSYRSGAHPVGCERRRTGSCDHQPPPRRVRESVR